MEFLCSGKESAQPRTKIPSAERRGKGWQTHVSIARSLFASTAEMLPTLIGIVDQLVGRHRRLRKPVPTQNDNNFFDIGGTSLAIA
jgi:hypothetical protein